MPRVYKALRSRPSTTETRQFSNCKTKECKEYQSHFTQIYLWPAFCPSVTLCNTHMYVDRHTCRNELKVDFFCPPSPLHAFFKAGASSLLWPITTLPAQHGCTFACSQCRVQHSTAVLLPAPSAESRLVSGQHFAVTAEAPVFSNISKYFSLKTYCSRE